MFHLPHFTPAQRINTLAWCLFFLALYTLIIKFVNPLIYFAAQGPAEGLSKPPILWDFWWAIHIFLGVCLLRREKYAWEIALIISLVEIAIIAAKFWIFWHHPHINFWTLSWYVNKCFVLTYFLCLAGYLFFPSIRQELKKSTPPRTTECTRPR